MKEKNTALMIGVWNALEKIPVRTFEETRTKCEAMQALAQVLKNEAAEGDGNHEGGEGA